MRFTPGAHELQELSFDPKPRRGNKEASTSQNSPSIADLTRIFQTLPPQNQAQGSIQGGVLPGATKIQQLFVQILVQVVPPVTIQQQVLAMAQQWHQQNASPLAKFSTYKNMPKNLEHFFSKLLLNDLNHIADEYIKIFEDAL